MQPLLKDEQDSYLPGKLRAGGKPYEMHQTLYVGKAVPSQNESMMGPLACQLPETDGHETRCTYNYLYME